MILLRLSSTSSLRRNRLSDLTTLLRIMNKKSEFYSEEDQSANSESEVVRQFRKLIPKDHKLSSDISSWKQLNQPQDLVEIPRVPDSLNETTLDDYVRTLNRVKTRKFDQNPVYVRKAFEKIVESNVLASVHTYNMILRFFATTHDFSNVKETMRLMNQRKLYPNTESFNFVLGPMRTSRHERKFALINMYLKQMRFYRQIPDLSTCYILFECLRTHRKPIYDYMVNSGCSLRPILPAVMAYKHDIEKKSYGELIAEMVANGQSFRDEPKLVAEFVRFVLDEYGPSQAWEFAMDRLENDISELTPSMLVHFVDHFVKANQLHNAIAMINNFDNHFLKRKVHKVYEILTMAMIDRPNSENWSVLVRRFYIESKTSFARTIMLPKEVAKLRARAKEYGYTNFNPEKLTHEELDLTSKVLESLQWSDPHRPIFELQKNPESFQEAAKFVA
ncbi:hypothetical protein KL944_003891 [Ogataea haglerorum]|nr:hypothetical protein KL944_003891 [Ogataea haglerorum]